MTDRLQLIDQHGRPLTDLRISVTDRCNFRCTFCMPADQEYDFLPQTEILTFEETTRVAKIFLDLGVRKLRVTGGEPLIRKEVEKLISQIAALPGHSDLALTTNGYLLGAKAKALKDAGLERITVSFHAMETKVFQEISGRKVDQHRVLQGIERAREVGLTPIKVNVTVIKGVNDDQIVDLARFFKDKGHTLRFIEYMDVGTVNNWNPDRVFSAKDIVETIHRELPLEGIGRERPEDVALRYRYRDGSGEIGIIPSITQPFCGDCSRIRLTSEGKLYTCLFGRDGHDLKSPLREGATDEELEELIVNIWEGRTDRYSEERARLLAKGEPLPKVEMFRLGG